ncbi:hypothetical protein L6R29_15780 [Myxococcota bacterium]|nr:hypothetical protein [Myxococcota bacterium]
MQKRKFQHFPIRGPQQTTLSNVRSIKATTHTNPLGQFGREVFVDQKLRAHASPEGRPVAG